MGGRMEKGGTEGRGCVEGERVGTGWEVPCERRTYRGSMFGAPLLPMPYRPQLRVPNEWCFCFLFAQAQTTFASPSLIVRPPPLPLLLLLTRVACTPTILSATGPNQSIAGLPWRRREGSYGRGTGAAVDGSTGFDQVMRTTP